MLVVMHRKRKEKNHDYGLYDNYSIAVVCIFLGIEIAFCIFNKSVLNWI